MARSTKDAPDPLMIGYVPAPPGAVDPLDAPGKAAPKAEQRATDVPDLLADDEEGAPFEDELAPPQLPKTALTQPPVEAREAAPPLRLEDPRELARRLAEEARQKATAAKPAPAPAPAEPVATAPAKSKLSDRAPAPAAPAPAAPAPAPVAAAPVAEAPVDVSRRKSLAERAARPVSAQDALKAAQEASIREADVAKAKKKTAKDAAKAAAAQLARPAPAPAPVAPAPAPVAAAPAAPVAPTVEFAALLAKALPAATLEREITVTNNAIFRALWMAHRARAQATRDLTLLFTASVLLDASDRVPAGCLVAAQVQIGDRSLAIWGDTARGTLLGFAEMPEVYLAGL